MKMAQKEKERRQRKKNEISGLPDAKKNQKIAELKLKNRNGMEEYRKRKREIKLRNLDSYRTVAAEKKALTKLRKVIPPAPLKRERLVTKLLHSFDNVTRDRIVRNSTPTKQLRLSRIDSDIIEAVIL